jgi:predicted SpoU family rRNA methylase
MPAPLEVRFLGPGNALISVDDVERIVETVEEVVRRFEQFAPDAE